MASSRFSFAHSKETESSRADTSVVRATLTVTEAAEVLGISRSSAYELVQSGGLPALRLGRRLVVPTHALEALLDSAQLDH
ncbi:MAG: helix-turn-helix domain-containing protein [bacterium]|nr:helix-turn-helix domain-containing protein [bacterium]